MWLVDIILGRTALNDSLWKLFGAKYPILNLTREFHPNKVNVFRTSVVSEKQDHLQDCHGNAIRETQDKLVYCSLTRPR